MWKSTAFLLGRRPAKIFGAVFLIGINSFPKHKLADLTNASFFGMTDLLERFLQLRIDPDSDENFARHFTE